jgi:hypothetical protein
MRYMRNASIANMRFMRYIVSAMPRPTVFPIKKLIGFDADLWEKVRDYRFSAKLNTESDAVRRLIEAGLSALKKSGTSSGGGGKSKIRATKPLSSPEKTKPAPGESRE